MSEIEEDAEEEKKSENASVSSSSSQDSEDQEDQLSVRNANYESEDNQQDMIQSYIKITPLEQKDDKPFLPVIEQ